MNALRIFQSANPQSGKGPFLAPSPARQSGPRCVARALFTALKTLISLTLQAVMLLKDYSPPLPAFSSVANGHGGRCVFNRSQPHVRRAAGHPPDLAFWQPTPALPHRTRSRVSTVRDRVANQAGQTG